MTRPWRVRSAVWLVIGVLGLLVCWVGFPSRVPIYDGIGNPDEPYRYVSAHSGQTTKPPSAAHADFAVEKGKSAAGYNNSDEYGPQVSMYVSPGALSAPASANQVALSAVPVAPASPLPADGRIVTNVYRLTATWSGGGSSGPSQLTSGGASASLLLLRAPDGRQPGPVLEHLVADNWQRVRTQRVGNDNYQGPLTSLGDWALVQPSTGHPQQHKTHGGGGGGLLAVGFAVLAAAVVLVVIRRGRRRPRAGGMR